MESVNHKHFRTNNLAQTIFLWHPRIQIIKAALTKPNIKFRIEIMVYQFKKVLILN